MRGKCERGRGSANADGAGAEAFAGDGYSQKASFGPMAAISRREQGRRIYNNTRARVLLRRMCVKPADLTTHSPPKTFPRPEHFLTPFPSTSAPPRNPDARPRSPEPRPQAARSIPRRRPPLAPAQRHALAEHFRSPPQRRRTPAGCAMHSRRPHNPFPAQRHAASPSVPLRAQKNGTAQCMCDAECLGRPSLRSVIWLVSRALFAAVAGRWRVGVGLRPQPWALRSRRCGRVLRA